MIRVSGRALMAQRRPKAVAANLNQSSHNESLRPHVQCTILCDTSAAMVDKFKTVQKSIVDLCKNFLRDYDKIELNTFSDLARKRYALKDKRYVQLNPLVSQIVPEVSQDSKARALYDGIGTTIESIDREQRRPDWLHEMIVITCGADNASKSSYREFQLLKRFIAKPPLEHFHLSIVVIEPFDGDSQELKRLCESVDHVHLAFCQNTSTELSNTFQQICKSIDSRRKEQSFEKLKQMNASKQLLGDDFVSAETNRIGLQMSRSASNISVLSNSNGSSTPPQPPRRKDIPI